VASCHRLSNHVWQPRNGKTNLISNLCESDNDDDIRWASWFNSEGFREFAQKTFQNFNDISNEFPCKLAISSLSPKERKTENP